MILERLMRPRFQAADLKTPAQWLIDALGGARSLSGQRVTAKTALAVAAYFACIRNISEDIAKLPMLVYEALEPRGKKRLPEHPVYRLLNESPNPEMSAMTFRETMTAHALGWKGGFAEIVRKGTGQPAELYPMDPNTIRVMRATGNGGGFLKNELFYRVQVETEQHVDLKADQVLHLHGLGFDGVTGYAMTQIARESIGSAIGVQKFGAAYFGNGAVATGYLKLPGVMAPEALKRMRESFAERHQGAQNAHKPIILEHGIEWVRSDNDPEKSQMIETEQFKVEEICRWFRVPPHKLGHLLRTAGWSTLEATNLDYYTDTLMPWMVRWKQEIKRRLLLPRERAIDTEHMITPMLRMDSALRAQYFTAMFNVGAMSQNDIRDMEDLNPIPNGDTYYVSANIVPAANQAEDTNNPPEPPADEEDLPLTVQPHAPADPGREDDGGDSGPFTTSEAPQNADTNGAVLAMLHDYETLLADAFARVLRVESDRVRAAAKRPGFDGWVGEFYGGSQDLLRREIGAPMDTLATSLWVVMTHKPPVEGLRAMVFDQTTAMAERHVTRSRDEAKDAAKVESWTQGARAREQARAETVRVFEIVNGLVKGTSK